MSQQCTHVFKSGKREGTRCPNLYSKTMQPWYNVTIEECIEQKKCKKCVANSKATYIPKTRRRRNGFKKVVKPLSNKITVKNEKNNNEENNDEDNSDEEDKNGEEDKSDQEDSE